ncbi:MAG: EAL domain-containing protein [Pseudomonadota bacterium]
MEDTNLFRIIIIDDNPSIHHDFIKILTTESFDEIDNLSNELFGKSNDNPELPKFQIDVASQGQEGVAQIKKALEEGNPYALAFVDIRMPPGWDGVETIKHIWELDKNIQVVICTAYSDYSWEDTIANLGKTDNLLILKKPFDNISVRQLASALTTKWQLAEQTRDYTAVLKQQVSDRTLSLQKSLSLIKSTFESSSDGIILLNNDGKIVDYNNKLLNMLQIPQNILETKEENIFLKYIADQLDNPEAFLSKIQELQRNPDTISIEIINFKDGKILEYYSQPHKLNDEIVGRIMDFRDITKRAMLEKELRYQATHDALTGLANRVKLHDKMKEAIKSSQQNQESFAVLFIDFDRFKLINDSLSHAVGDKLLKSAAQRLQSSINPDDVIARLGGDEFVIILMNVNNANSLKDRVNNLINVFQEPFDLDSRQIMLTASIGISVYPKDGDTSDVLLRNSDAAMYHAKAQKGNNFQFFDAKMNKESLAKLDDEIELRQALANNEFFLCYQPQIDLVNENLIAVEALIRWKHPTKGVLLPIDFVSVAEESGLIVPICEWALRTACLQNKMWQDAGFPFIRVAVNVMAQQFKQYNIIEKVKDILEETGLDPKFLELELTENVILSNPEIIKVITELKKIGVIIAIDDFGTGYSSLSYLHKIPLDRLKIDSSFIQHIQFNSDDEAIIGAVIALAKNLNLEVLAEGVETTDQVNFLKKYKYGDVQGYYFSKPLSAGDVEVLFDNPKQFKQMVTTENKSKE